MKNIFLFTFLFVSPFLLSAQWNNAISGRLFKDVNQNGMRDVGDLPADNSTVWLYDCGNDKIAHSIDDILLDSIYFYSGTMPCSSCYSFNNLAPSVYYVKFPRYLGNTMSGNGYALSPMNVGSDATDSDAFPLFYETAEIVLDSGAIKSNVDAGYFTVPILCISSLPVGLQTQELLSPLDQLTEFDTLFLPKFQNQPFFDLKEVEIRIKPIISVRRWVENDDTMPQIFVQTSIDTIKIKGLGLSGSIIAAPDTFHCPVLYLATSDGVYMSGADYQTDTTFWVGLDTVITLTDPDTLAAFVGNDSLIYYYKASGAAFTSGGPTSFSIKTLGSLRMTVNYKYCEYLVPIDKQVSVLNSYSVYPQYNENQLLLKFKEDYSPHPLAIHLYNSMGGEILHTQSHVHNGELPLLLPPISSGIYYISVEGKVEKFIW